MYKKLLFAALLLLGTQFAESQGLKGLLSKAKDAISGKSTGNLSNDDIVAGLKAALVQGSQNGADLLSKTDGFFANAAVKILMPPEAVKVENTLRKLGFGKQVDEAILSMNRAAEDACKQAAPIFGNAIKQMSFQDALGILKGSDTAATAYLRNKTQADLGQAFKPVIENSLQKVNATKYWNTLFSTYNKFSLQKVNPDLSGYVTERALGGIFYEVAQEEEKIRKDPLARTSDILKKVFGAKS
ncbi:MAG TPA: DUF4197 domain-containing protein [Sediminibacterium sp.]|nr:DUF4197 domain-containing protein [Sediminibacterium sp.]